MPASYEPLKNTHAKPATLQYVYLSRIYLSRFSLQRVWVWLFHGENSNYHRHRPTDWPAVSWLKFTHSLRCWMINAAAALSCTSICTHKHTHGSGYYRLLTKTSHISSSPSSALCLFVAWYYGRFALIIDSELQCVAIKNNKSVHIAKRYHSQNRLAESQQQSQLWTISLSGR